MSATNIHYVFDGVVLQIETESTISEKHVVDDFSEYLGIEMFDRGVRHSFPQFVI